jgi:hypothetical protein
MKVMNRVIFKIINFHKSSTYTTLVLISEIPWVLASSIYNRITLSFFKRHSTCVYIDEHRKAISFENKLNRDNIKFKLTNKLSKDKSRWFTSRSHDYNFYIDNKHSAWIVANIL